MVKYGIVHLLICSTSSDYTTSHYAIRHSVVLFVLSYISRFCSTPVQFYFILDLLLFFLYMLYHLVLFSCFSIVQHNTSYSKSSHCLQCIAAYHRTAIAQITGIIIICCTVLLIFCLLIVYYITLHCNMSHHITLYYTTRVYHKASYDSFFCSIESCPVTLHCPIADDILYH